jgi:hypothetical protein
MAVSRQPHSLILSTGEESTYLVLKPQNGFAYPGEDHIIYDGPAYKAQKIFGNSALTARI